MSVLGREIAKTPFAVVDVETTGIDPRRDRVVEIAVVVVRAGEDPRVVLDTLVRPERPVAGTEVHGLADHDLERAPTFAEIAEVVVASVANRVVAAHNASFDIGMLAAELDRCGYRSIVPHLCTMLLPRALDPTVPALSLRSACARRGVELSEEHRASHDAMAAAQILALELRAMRRRIGTFAELRAATAAPYPFLESLTEHMLPPPSAMHSNRRLVPRGGGPARRRRGELAEYLEAVLDAAADLMLSDEEIASIAAFRESAGISREEVRAIHARVFSAMLTRFVEDTRIDLVEVRRMEQLRTLLSRLGWAPGDPAV